jgi:undecaprenyl diphosphate synthase
MQVPTHLAIIMDGNGRWAEQRHLPRILGHRKGVETVQSVVDECLKLGVRYLTLYAFSSENWGRPQDEVEALIGLLGSFLKKELSQLQEQGIRLMAVGELDRLPKSINQILQDIIQKTADPGTFANGYPFRSVHMNPDHISGFNSHFHQEDPCLPDLLLHQFCHRLFGNHFFMVIK